MAIEIKGNQFHLKTKNTSYVMGVHSGKYITHIYWGSKIKNDVDLTYFPDEFIYSRANAFHVPIDKDDRIFLTDIPLEFSVVGGGDYRNPTFNARYGNGSTVTELEYDRYEITDGKKALCGLPASYSENGDCKTLDIYMTDKLTGLCVILSYSVFEELDIITRNIQYINNGNEDIHILSAQSMSIDFAGQDYKFLTLQGDWCRERHIEAREVGHSMIKIESKRGMSSHMQNPFAVLHHKNTDEFNGDAYGFLLVYSGNFDVSAEGNSAGNTRVTMGINDFNFDWNLTPGEAFQTPEAVLVYSDCGLNRMSQLFHTFIRKRIMKPAFRDSLRPMIINNWEATSFNFDEDKLFGIAENGSKIGMEMFVLDDGWFGKRDNDRCSLGDWYAHKDKLPSGIKGVAERINKLGMKFGLWVEPEMISPDSDLYREHPDWCIHADGRNRTLNRHELVLDLSRSEVCDYLIDVLSRILDSANIEYIKWDCNRNITETKDQMQSHKFVLGLYRILDTLTEKYPNVLFEGCSGGGGRFDAGILHYMPQTWTSDNTRPAERLFIQYGTSMAYPPISMTAHIGRTPGIGQNCENEQMKFSGMVAMAATFGFELDLTKLSEAELAQAKSYAELYKYIRPTVQLGNFYRLENPADGAFCSWEFVDSNRAVVFAYQMHPQINGEERRIKLYGLEENSKYSYNDRVYFGEELMKLGIRVPVSGKDIDAQCMVFEKLS